MDSLLMKGGSGADLDLVTAGVGDVLAGKVIVDKNGNPLTGTMPDKGAWTGRIDVNGKIVIPKGYHNGAGYVDQAITNRGAVAATLPINGSYTIPEGYHNGKGTVKQSIATFGAQTVKPGTSAKSVATSGKYGTGNITVAACSLPAAANLKKGVVYTLPDGSTVTGTYEGFRVYKRGTWGGWEHKVSGSGDQGGFLRAFSKTSLTVTIMDFPVKNFSRVCFTIKSSANSSTKFKIDTLENSLAVFPNDLVHEQTVVFSTTLETKSFPLTFNSTNLSRESFDFIIKYHGSVAVDIYDIWFE